MTFPQVLDALPQAAEALADIGLDLIVFHCTGTAMAHGAEGERQIVDAITRATGVPAMATGSAVTGALRAAGIRKLVLISPYQNNLKECAYLEANGFEVVHDVALRTPTIDAFTRISPARWCEVARENARPDADGIFLSCTNTTQIDAVAPLESEFDKPVINSNQAALWASVRQLRGKLADWSPPASLGRLMTTLN